MEQNSCLQVRLRKDRNTLVVVGAGVIAFGVWSVIKAVMYAAVNIETLLVTRSGERLSPAAFWIALAVIVAIELALRVYVGRSAIAEGRGVKKGALYIVLAILMGLSACCPSSWSRWRPAWTAPFCRLPRRWWSS